MGKRPVTESGSIGIAVYCIRHDVTAIARSIYILCYIYISPRGHVGHSHKRRGAGLLYEETVATSFPASSYSDLYACIIMNTLWWTLLFRSVLSLYSYWLSLISLLAGCIPAGADWINWFVWQLFCLAGQRPVIIVAHYWALPQHQQTALPSLMRYIWNLEGKKQPQYRHTRYTYTCTKNVMLPQLTKW